MISVQVLLAIAGALLFGWAGFVLARLLQTGGRAEVVDAKDLDGAIARALQRANAREPKLQGLRPASTGRRAARLMIGALKRRDDTTQAERGSTSTPLGQAGIPPSSVPGGSRDRGGSAPRPSPTAAVVVDAAAVGGAEGPRSAVVPVPYAPVFDDEDGDQEETLVLDRPASEGGAANDRDTWHDAAVEITILSEKGSDLGRAS
jgi:hypothetical protein